MSQNKSYIDENGDALELDEAWFAKARRGRPPLPPEKRKKSVHMMLDPDILARLKSEGRGWQTRANALLRAALGL